MPLAKGLFITFCTASLVFSQDAAPKKDKKQLTARDLFYDAGDTPAPKPALAKSAAKAPIRSTKTRPKPVEIARADPKPNPGRPQNTTAPAAAPAVPAAAQPAPQTAPMPAAGEVALGIRYTLLKLADDNSQTEVPVDTVFRSGDHIAFTVEPNASGYLYIVNQGSDGTWQAMFPTPDFAEGSNRVQGWRPYTMPPGHRLTFDTNAGTENLFIVFSRQPEPDLEKLIYSLQSGGKRADKPEEPVQSDRSLIVAANIGNPLIDRLRKANSRNLIVEKIDVNTPGDKKETAVYVVNPSGSADSRVVADLHLVHK